MLHKEEVLVQKLVQQTMLCNCGLKETKVLARIYVKNRFKTERSGTKRQFS